MGYKTEEPIIAPWIDRKGAGGEDGVGSETWRCKRQDVNG